jgi:hypothetical protein
MMINARPLAAPVARLLLVIHLIRLVPVMAIPYVDYPKHCVPSS